MTAAFIGFMACRPVTISSAPATKAEAGCARWQSYYPRTYYPDSSEIGKAAIIDVSEGGEAKNIDIKLGRRALTYSVGGRIGQTQKAGQPLPGIFHFRTAPSSRIKTKASSAALPAHQSPTNSRG